jgi:hypothetical protein
MTRNVYLFGTCVIDLFMPQAGLDAVRASSGRRAQIASQIVRCCSARVSDTG